MFRSNVCIWRLRFSIRWQSRTVLFICRGGSICFGKSVFLIFFFLKKYDLLLCNWGNTKNCAFCKNQRPMVGWLEAGIPVCVCVVLSENFVLVSMVTTLYNIHFAWFFFHVIRKQRPCLTCPHFFDKIQLRTT